MQLGDKEAAALLGLVHDENFMLFVQEKAWNYESKADFFASEMPCGLSPDAAWELVSFVRRMSGWPSVREQVPRRSKSLAPDLTFQTTPPVAERALQNLDSRCHDHSRLWESLEPMVQRRRIIGPLVEDLLAASQREGFKIDYETVRALANGRHEPSDDEERVVANAIALLDSGPDVPFPPTADSLRTVYDDLVQGTALPQKSSSVAPPTSVPDAFLVRRIDFEEFASMLGKEGCWGNHPLLDIIMNSDSLWNSITIGPANAFFEIVLRRTALMRMGLPVIAHVPLSSLRLNWERGLSPETMEPFRYGEAFLVSQFGLDCTPYLIQMLAMIDHYIDKLAAKTSALKKDDEEKRKVIYLDARLSHRQKELLASMIVDPTTSIDVGAYARRFECAVSTARDDLNRLVDLRYCSMAYQGKKQVFRLNESSRFSGRPANRT